MSPLSPRLLEQIAGTPAEGVSAADDEQSGEKERASPERTELRLGSVDSAVDLADIAARASELAKHIQRRASQLQTPAERRQQAELDRMLQHPADKITLTQMTDQGFRSRSADRVVDQLIHILDVQGIPRFFSQLDRALLRGFQSFGNYLPGVAVPMVKDKMRKETSNVILPAERELLREHLLDRREEGIRMNVNFLGEAILGEKEAQRRLEKYLSALQQPEIEVVSVKISTLYSQISPLARPHTLQVLGDRLELLYRAAERHHFQPRSGPAVPKFVYLDMEEYRDMSLTSAAFMSTLDRPGLEHARAGIALQAYIPDSFLVQQTLTQWAQGRIKQGGSPVTIRIVKGANMEMERVEASLRGWPQAPYKTKLETDANYKRMLFYGMQPDRIAAARIAVASHNLFEVAFALVLAKRLGVLDRVQFEMLEGMANHQRRALHELTDNLLLYAPACTQQDFTSAIGYLVRRLDENTGPDNFLRHAFKISVDSPAWQRLETQLVASTRMMATVSAAPRRTQDRHRPPQQPSAPATWTQYINEPDTDFSLEQNGRWAEEIVQQWQERCDSRAIEIPVTVNGHDEKGGGELYESHDSSRPGVIVARYHQATADQLRRAVTAAEADSDGWCTMEPTHRYRTLRGVAQRLRERRGDLVGAAMADGAKTVLESDPEVSEAIDFVEFYARTALDLAEGNYSTRAARESSKSSRGLGTVLVISPWNFPIAIPCGGIAAALAAGNTVILKPASDTVLPARILCECFWEAGVSRRALQLVPCSGRAAGETLLTDPRIDAVVLTGGTATAQHFLTINPALRLFAETGGKNATIVSSLSDHDQAIKNVVHSAFTHAGQKCSATSLLLLEEEVYHDERFRDSFIDAVSSIRVGSAWDLSTRMGPLIRPPSGVLLRGLKELEAGERWALMPENRDENPCLYSPGIKWDVPQGGFTHLTELFGPLLAVMPYRHLSSAIALVHQTGYGLTSGLETLDDRERSQWTSRLRAGNLYVNRATTGAVVLRQPFGGLGKSSFGPGIKAGGPNYVVPLMAHPTALDSTQIHSTEPPTAQRPEHEPLAELWDQMHDSHVDSADQLRQMFTSAEWLALERIVEDYADFAMREILGNHDTVRLIGQDNIRRYLPLTHLRIRVTHSDHPLDIMARVLAARAAGARAVVSADRGVHAPLLEHLEELTHHWGGASEFIEESDSHLVEAIKRHQVDRLRYASPACVPAEVRSAANEAFVYVADVPVSAHGRVELLWYVREQSLSVDYHRYGNLGARSDELRREPL